MNEWNPISSMPKDGRKLIVLKPLGIKQGFTVEVLSDWDFANGWYRDLVRNGSPSYWIDYDESLFDDFPAWKK